MVEDKRGKEEEATMRRKLVAISTSGMLSSVPGEQPKGGSC